MSTECKDCRYKKGDCGHHFISDGVVNYDIPTQTACDNCDNCMFFAHDMDESKGDLTRRSVLNDIWELYKKYHRVGTNFHEFGVALKDIIDNAPTIELQMGRMTNGVIIPIERPQGKWIKHDFPDCDGFWDYKCSECEKVYGGEYNYCPNCGCKMEGVEDNG